MKGAAGLATNTVARAISSGLAMRPVGLSDSARDLLTNLRASAPNRPEVEEVAKALSTRLLDSGKQATAAKAFDRANQLISAAKEVGNGFNAAAIAQAEADLASGRDANALQTNIVSAAALKRTRMVSPVYPESARKRGIEGWVELAFTVTPSGTVEDIEVRNASPAGTFDDAAIRKILGENALRVFRAAWKD